MKRIFLICLLFACNIFSQEHTPVYIATGSNAPYFPCLLQLIGGLHRVDYDALVEIAVFDLGLTQDQINFLKTIQKVQVYSIEMTHPDLLCPFVTTNWDKRVPGWYAWKPVAIKQALDMFPYVLWLDAGTTVLRSIEHVLAYIKEHGYLLVTIGMKDDKGNIQYPIEWGTTQWVRNAFNLNNEQGQKILEKEFVMGGFNGVSREYKNLFIIPLYECSKDLRYYQDDGTTPNGFGTGRHDQTLLSILAYSKNLTVFEQDDRQQEPILLSVQNEVIPFYITWQKKYVCDKTHIYNSRGSEDLEYYESFIRFK